jgi:hypothetical protein
MIAAFIAGFILVQAPSPTAINDKTTAATLAEDCADSDLGDLCLTYLTNAADAMRDPSNTALKGAACLSPKLGYDELKRAYLTFVRHRPSVVNDPAVIVILQAYATAFPCR